MADWLQDFVAMKVPLLVRFGRWQKILDESLLGDPEPYRATTAMFHYAIGGTDAIYLHELTTDPTREYDCSCVVDVNTKGMAKTKLSCSILDMRLAAGQTETETARGEPVSLPMGSTAR